MPPVTNSFIYLVYSEIGIMIGRSSDVSRRFAIIDSNSPIDLQLLRVYRIEKNRIHEKRLHKCYAAMSIRGGWFALGIKEIKEIDKYMTENKGNRILDNLSKVNQGPVPLIEDPLQNPYKDIKKDIDRLEEVVEKLKGTLDGRSSL